MRVDAIRPMLLLLLFAKQTTTGSYGGARQRRSFCFRQHLLCRVWRPLERHSSNMVF